MGPQNPHSNHSTTNPTLAAQPAGHLGLSSYPAVLICLVNTLWVTIACSQQPHLEVSPHFSTTTNTIASHKMPAGNLCKPSERPVPLAAALLPFPETTCGKELGPHIPAGPMAAAFRTGSADLERERVGCKHLQGPVPRKSHTALMSLWSVRGAGSSSCVGKGLLHCLFHLFQWCKQRCWAQYLSVFHALVCMNRDMG